MNVFNKPGEEHALAPEPGNDPDDFAAAYRAAPSGAQVRVSFDENLWLRNSTEEYLKSLRPAAIAILILGLLDLLRPWRFFPSTGDPRLNRNRVRVAVTSILLPWSLPLWRRRAPSHAREWYNSNLAGLLNERPDMTILIVTSGFSALVAPLLQHMNSRMRLERSYRLWAYSRVWKKSDDSADAPEAPGPCALGVAAEIADADLLAPCRSSFIVRWPGAKSDPAFGHSYLPLAYTERGKRANERYLLHHVILEDMLFLCLACAWLMPNFFAGAISIILMHLSFWLIYEIGYAENDAIAVKNEVNPNIPPASLEQGQKMHPGIAWLTALALSIPAVILLVVANGDAIPLLHQLNNTFSMFAVFYVAWVFYLESARAAYWIYNRIDVVSRIQVYPILQCFRSLFYGILLPINAIGAALLLSLVIYRWIPYLAYRYIGSRLTGPGRLLLLGVFIFVSVSVFVVDARAMLSLQFILALGWLVARAHKPIRELARSLRFFPADRAR